MPISAASKEFKTFIRSLNLKRNKLYRAAQFDTLKKNNGADEAAIKTASTDFSIDTLVKSRSPSHEAFHLIYLPWCFKMVNIFVI